MQGWWAGVPAGSSAAGKPGAHAGLRFPLTMLFVLHACSFDPLRLGAEPEKLQW